MKNILIVAIFAVLAVTVFVVLDMIPAPNLQAAGYEAPRATPFVPNLADSQDASSFQAYSGAEGAAFSSEASPSR